VIPTFALERAQEILYYLRIGVEQGRLPASLTVFLDSPMAILATEAFRDHPEAVAAPVAQMLQKGEDPFAVSGLHLARDGAASRAINAISGGAVIMAGSGMCTGGRVMHHLQHNLARDACSVIFVGYAAVGTPARRIIDGAESVRLFGEEIPVRARIYTINGFSAHADRDELLAWHAKVAAPRTFLVHGDADVMQKFAARLTGTTVELPEPGQSFPL
jgi:metallo-beta-lactamase family protein